MINMKEFNANRKLELLSKDKSLTNSMAESIIDLENQMTDNKDMIITLSQNGIIDSLLINEYIEKCFNVFLKQVQSLFGSKTCKNLYDYLPNEELAFIKKEKTSTEKPLYPLLHTPIRDLDLKVRTANCILAQNVQCLGELIQKTEPEVLLFDNLGKKSLNEIKAVLSEMGLGFGIAVDNLESMKQNNNAEKKYVEGSQHQKSKV